VRGRQLYLVAEVDPSAAAKLRDSSAAVAPVRAYCAYTRS
jgi:hypothetical protein